MARNHIWSRRKKQESTRQSPLKMIIWGVLLLFAIIGFLARG